MRFPVVLKNLDPIEAPAKLYYVVASNGVFQVRDTDAYRAVTRVFDGIPGLLAECEQVELRSPRLPTLLLEEVLAFFGEAYRQYGGEAIVILFYNSETREFRVGVPVQHITRYDADRWGAHLHQRYDALENPPGSVRFGTIHSHANLPAYASHVDCQDERFEDGLHIVFGNLKSENISRSASFVANGLRFRLEPDAVLEQARMPERHAQREWMQRVRCETRPGLSSDSWREGKNSGQIIDLVPKRESGDVNEP